MGYNQTCFPRPLESVSSVLISMEIKTGKNIHDASLCRFSILFEYQELVSVFKWKCRCLDINVIKMIPLILLSFHYFILEDPDQPCMTRTRDFWTIIFEYLILCLRAILPFSEWNGWGGR